MTCHLRFVILFFGSIVSTVLLEPNTTHAIPVLDQSYTPTGSRSIIVASRLSLAQTSTIGLTGTLTHVEVNVGQLSPTIGHLPLTVDIRKTTGGVPVESNSPPDVLASVSLSSSAIPTTGFGWVTFDLPDFTVSNGDVIALVLSSATTVEYTWNANINAFGDPAGTYAGGRGFARGSSGPPTWGNLTFGGSGIDFAFRLFVDETVVTPEPSTFMLIGIGLAGFGFFRRRRQAA